MRYLKPVRRTRNYPKPDAYIIQATDAVSSVNSPAVAAESLTGLVKRDGLGGRGRPVRLSGRAIPESAVTIQRRALPDQLQRELQLSVVGRRVPNRAEDTYQRFVDDCSGNRSPGRVEVRTAVQYRFRYPEDGVVEEIESLEPELKFQLFPEIGSLHGAEVEGDELRAARAY